MTKCWSENSLNISKYGPKSNHKSFYLARDVYKIAQIVTNYLDHFSKKICHQKVWKITQSGHTALSLSLSLSLALPLILTVKDAV